MLAVIVGFVMMEPATYAAHRWIMHGIGLTLHRSHHRTGDGGWQANDLYPVIFASVVIGAMAVGFNVAGDHVLVPVSVGITAYGIAYGLVHDVYIHARLPLFRHRHASLQRLADAHDLHHRFGGEPYGMLLPIVPAALRARSLRERPSIAAP